MALLLLNNLLDMQQNNDVFFAKLAAAPLSYKFSWQRCRKCVFLFRRGGSTWKGHELKGEQNSTCGWPNLYLNTQWEYIALACKNGVWDCGMFCTLLTDIHPLFVPVVLQQQSKRCSLIQKVVSSFKTLLFPTFKNVIGWRFETPCARRLCTERQFALFPTIYFFANHCKVCVPFLVCCVWNATFVPGNCSRQQTSSCSLPENFQLGKMDKNSRVPVCVYFRKLSLSPLCAKNSR